MMKKGERKAPRKLKVIWEYDKDMPEEKRRKRIGQAFEILLNKTLTNNKFYYKTTKYLRWRVPKEEPLR